MSQNSHRPIANVEWVTQWWWLIRVMISSRPSFVFTNHWWPKHSLFDQMRFEWTEMWFVFCQSFFRFLFVGFFFFFFAQILYMVGRGFLRPDLNKLRSDVPKSFKKLLSDCIKFNRDERPLFTQVSELLWVMIGYNPRIPAHTLYGYGHLLS